METPEKLNPVSELAVRELSRRRLLDFRKYMSPGYSDSWHHRLICGKLEAVERGEIKRLIISMPPRSGKSHLASEAFPAWFLGRNPTQPVISVSYGADLSEVFGRRVRNMMASRDFVNLFPASELSKDSQAVDRFCTKSGGEYMAVGVGGALTGRGGKLIVLDDPVKNWDEAQSETNRDKQWEWYRSTLYTRLMPGGAVVVIGTRWHPDDLIGRLMSEGGWEIINLKAIADCDDGFRKSGDALWPEWFPLSELEKTRDSVGPIIWNALYQGNPVESGKTEFSQEWIKVRTSEEVDALKTVAYLAVDTALSRKETDDRTGFALVRVDSEGKWNVRSWNDRVDPKQLIFKLFDLHEKWNFREIHLERTSYTDGLKPFLDDEMRKRNTWLPIRDALHKGRAKEIRIRGLIPMYSSGNVYHEKGQCHALESEMLRFPMCDHDDCLDSLAYLLGMTFSPGMIKENLEDEKKRPKFISYLRRNFK